MKNHSLPAVNVIDPTKLRVLKEATKQAASSNTESFATITIATKSYALGGALCEEGEKSRRGIQTPGRSWPRSSAAS
jgi:hypothetical protein